MDDSSQGSIEVEEKQRFNEIDFNSIDEMEGTDPNKPPPNLEEENNKDENQAEEIFNWALFSRGEANIVENSAFNLNTISGIDGGLIEGSTDTKPDRKRPVSWRIGSAYSKKTNARDN